MGDDNREEQRDHKGEIPGTEEQGLQRPADCLREGYVMSTGQAHAGIMRGCCPTLAAAENERPIYMDEINYEVRRLTPTECARLQGFPPDWAADIPHTDSAEYKMWGNGIALPCIIPMMKSMHDILGGLHDDQEEDEGADKRV